MENSANRAAQTVTVDLRGQVCPSTLLVAMAAINKNRQHLRNGEIILQLLTDNEQASETIPAAARNMGYSVELKSAADSLEILIWQPMEKKKL